MNINIIQINAPCNRNGTRMVINILRNIWMQVPQYGYVQRRRWRGCRRRREHGWRCRRGRGRGSVSGSYAAEAAENCPPPPPPANGYDPEWPPLPPPLSELEEPPFPEKEPEIAQSSRVERGRGGGGHRGRGRGGRGGRGWWCGRGRGRRGGGNTIRDAEECPPRLLTSSTTPEMPSLPLPPRSEPAEASAPDEQSRAVPME